MINSNSDIFLSCFFFVFVFCLLHGLFLVTVYSLCCRSGFLGFYILIGSKSQRPHAYIVLDLTCLV